MHGEHLLSAELLEQILQLGGRGEQDQPLEQARAGLAVGDLEFLAVGFLVDALEKKRALAGRLKLVQLEHLVGALEVLLLVVVEHAVELHLAGAGDLIGGCMLQLRRLGLLDVLLVVVGLVALGGCVAVAVALALLLVVAAAALLVFLGHGDDGEARQKFCSSATQAGQRRLSAAATGQPADIQAGSDGAGWTGDSAGVRHGSRRAWSKTGPGVV